MKSLKSVLVVAFACAMLFAFTACEQQIPTYRNVDYILISQNTPFIEGQSFNAANFDVTIYYTDNTSTVVSGTGLVTATSWPTDTTVTAKVGEETATYEAAVIDQDDCDITVVLDDEVTTPIKANAADGEVRNVSVDVVSVTFSTGDVSYTLSDDSAYSASVAVGAEELKIAGTYELEATVVKSTTTVATVPVSVEVVDSTPAPTVVTGVHVLYDVTRNGSKVVENATSLSGLYLNDVVTVTVYQTATKDGEDASTVLSAASAFENANDDVTYSSGVASITVGKEAVSDTIYYYNEEVGETKTATVTVPVGSNTVVKEGASLVLTPNTATALAAGTTLAGNADLSTYVNFTEGNGLKNLDSSLETVSYSIYVDPARTYKIPETETVSVNCFVTYLSYGETVKEFHTVSLSAQAGQQQ